MLYLVQAAFVETIGQERKIERPATMPWSHLAIQGRAVSRLYIAGGPI